MATRSAGQPCGHFERNLWAATKCKHCYQDRKDHDESALTSKGSPAIPRAKRAAAGSGAKAPPSPLLNRPSRASDAGQSPTSVKASTTLSQENLTRIHLVSRQERHL